MLIDYRATTDPRHFTEHISARVLPPHVVVDGKYQPGRGDALLLMPGVQHVEKSAWEQVKNGGGAKEMLDNGQIRVLPENFDLSKLPLFEAQPYVDRTIDVKVLTEWREQIITAPSKIQPQARAQLLQAIDKRIKECTTDISGATVTQVMPRLLQDNEVVLQ